MKLKEFTYNDKARSLYQMLSTKGDYVEGIECNQMPKEDFEAFSAIVEDFHKKLDPFMQYYRRFDPTKITP